MKKIILTVVVTLVILIIGFYLYIFSGNYNISQMSPHNKLTKSIIHITTHNSIQKRIKGIEVPSNLNDSSVLITGFKHYNEMCVMCHGAPGVKPNEMAEGLYPKPPALFKFAEKDDAQEFFWIIKNGIKMTSMPGLQPTHDDNKIWAITAFVTQKLPKMKPEEYKDWLTKYGSGDEGSDDDK